MEQNNKNVALVLSSGGPRGFAYIGAIEALEEHGYTITSIAGTSIGSLVGGIYAAGNFAYFLGELCGLHGCYAARFIANSVSDFRKKFT